MVEWQESRFADLCVHSAFGPRFSSDEYSPHGNVACLRTMDIDANGRIDLDAMPLAQLDLARFRNHVLRCGDLVVTRTGAYLGKAAVFDDFRLPVLPGAFSIRFRVNHEIADPYFLRYYFNSIQGQAAIASIRTGSAQPNINIPNLHKLSVPVPPLVHQKSIVSVLRALDDRIELNRKMNETLEQMAQAIFKSWFIDFDGHTEFQDSPLGPIPKGWRTGTIQQIQSPTKNATTAGPFGSKLTRAHYTPDGVPVIRGVNLGGDAWFHDDDFVYISEEYADEMAGCVAARGDVLFTQRGTLGQVGLIPADSRYARYMLSQSQMKLTCADWMPATYIFLLFRQPSTIEYIKSNSVAAGVPHINLGFLRSFPLVIPPKEMLVQFHRALHPLERKLQANTRESQTLMDLRDALLPRLISGEIRIKDAEKAVGEAT